MTASSAAGDKPAPEPEPTPESALEAALAQLGPCGFYQKYLLVLLCLPNLLAAMYSLSYVFVADQVPFRCVVPECEGAAPAFAHAAAAALLPREPCRRFAPLAGAACLREHYHPNLTVPCDAFVYETQDTVFAEFDLGCREWLRTLVGSVRGTALPVALLLTGFVSDTFGRRAAFCLFSSCAALLGIAKAFSVTYRMYLAMEWLEAALGYGFSSAAYVMLVEVAHPSLRAASACATGVVYGLGGVLLAGVAHGLRYWRHVLWTAHALALPLPLYWLLLGESPRWLHARGDVRGVQAYIRKVARWNKITVDEDLMQGLSEPRSEAGAARATGGQWRQLARSRVLLARFALCAWCWAATTFVYYGLTINSVALAGDRFVNFALNMAMEVVASLLIMMALERVGRRLCIFLAFLLCGAACVTPFFIAHAGASLALFFVGKLSITFAFNSLYLFTTELYPTAARGSALAACSLVGRAGSVLAPQTPLLEWYVQAALYAACSALAALAVLCLPETRRARLPQAVRDAERMAPARPPPPAPAPPPPPRPRVLCADT